MFTGSTPYGYHSQHSSYLNIFWKLQFNVRIKTYTYCQTNVGIGLREVLLHFVYCTLLKLTYPNFIPVFSVTYT